ncbi:hypothetical protein LptCag_0231 [Leptospirillum ferriphilum]|uniref:Uncharacterized protein n=1 Tax=Leptospirillum ferriphilum TaxID=178606 RepID=A0A094W7Z9_9BACT|nr:hypothetical protein LptCag_0231 [Leptospirillum ferriphilum]
MNERGDFMVRQYVLPFKLESTNDTRHFRRVWSCSGSFFPP